MYNYGIGGNEVKLDASESISDISNNKTLLVQKLTIDDAVKPEAVYDLKSIEDVFEHYKPHCTVDFETEEGTTKTEEMHFANLGDFGVKTIIEKSPFLTNINTEVEQYNKIAKQFKSNKVLKSLIENPESKQHVTDALTALLHELNSTGNE